ncbi:dTDP-4-dehydrorhamnose 3,5-epimerase [Geminocystis herdmanii]|uniref:dTDP-4-dehydrorhamnose 3,5-epimerase n=1 Tax=Geminocystis herdmanii TaxID=669359 RepID=UPI0003466D8C|nr:dTDP-4-dehydrorhamnose 3,5-epimerase [Geminocystis herdmanii]
MHRIETKRPNCYQLQPKKFEDNRGSFVKTFHEEIFQDLGLDTNFAEEYYSFSYQNVVRGLHFQLPPHEHIKIVYCVQGAVKDVVVDLRVNSPTYGQFEIFDLSAEKANLIYIPSGLAHGFAVMSETAIMMYKVSTVYHPESDTGIRYDSLGIPWEIDKPIISQRDSSFIPFVEFQSPFIYP